MIKERTIEKQCKFFKNKIVLVTGGTGSIGSEIVRRLLKFHPKAIRIFSNDENGLFNLQQELGHHKELRFLIGDVRDKDRLRIACQDVDILFHTAALKHVPLCEYNPFEAVKTNVLGTQNLIEAALLENIEKFIFISTDKAVNPTSTMGASKLLCEKLVIDACSYRGKRKTAFSCVRFGNVLGSRGSVIEVFKHQIENGGPVTITHPEMTRFVMLLSQAVDLIFKATGMAKGGEIFVLKMPALRVIDLVDVMTQELTDKKGSSNDLIRVKVVGRRAGEKIHEEVMTVYEAENAVDLGNMYVILPSRNIGENFSYYQQFKHAKVRAFTSQETRLLSKDEIRGLIKAFLKKRD